MVILLAPFWANPVNFPLEMTTNIYPLSNELETSVEKTDEKLL
jgi:hypothetical protein